VHQSLFCAESMPKCFSDKLQINVMPLVSLKYFSSLLPLFKWCLLLQLWTFFFNHHHCHDGDELSRRSVPQKQSVQTKNRSSFFKMLTANWSPSNTNTSSSPRMCFSLGSGSCLMSKEPRSPGLLVGEAEVQGDSVSCSVCGFVDQG